MPFPSYSGGPKSNLNAFPMAKRRKDNPMATKNQKKTRSGNTIDTGPSNGNGMLQKVFGKMRNANQ